MKGRFRGTWETTGPRHARLLAVPVIVAVLLTALATVLWLLALIGGVLLVLAIAAVIVLRRGSQDDRDALAQQAARLHAQATAPEIHTHYHLHVGDGEDADTVRRAIERHMRERP